MYTQKVTILTVDDDPVVYKGLTKYLSDHGYDVLRTESGDQCLRILKTGNQNIDAILMDLQLPDKDGFALITQIRELTNVPILIVSKSRETASKVIGLELGADDYVEKPFDQQELLARIKAALRRHHEVPKETIAAIAKEIVEQTPGALPANKTYKFDDWHLNPQTLMLINPDNRQIELTAGEFDLLRVFIQVPGRVLSREQLFDLVKKEGYENYDRAIDIQISRLRKKLNDDPKSPSLIKTVHGAGYIFNTEVEEIDE